MDGWPARAGAGEAGGGSQRKEKVQCENSHQKAHGEKIIKAAPESSCIMSVRGVSTVVEWVKLPSEAPAFSVSCFLFSLSFALSVTLPFEHINKENFKVNIYIYF